MFPTDDPELERSPDGDWNSLAWSNSRLEGAYHRADKAIQNIVDLLAAATQRPLSIGRSGGRRPAIEKRSYIRFADELPRGGRPGGPFLPWAGIWKRCQMFTDSFEPLQQHSLQFPVARTFINPASSVVSGYDFPGCRPGVI